MKKYAQGGELPQELVDRMARKENMEDREMVAGEYVTKQEVHHDINRVLDRLDRLEMKIDTFIREQQSAIR